MSEISILTRTENSSVFHRSVAFPDVTYNMPFFYNITIWYIETFITSHHVELNLKHIAYFVLPGLIDDF